LQHLLSLKTLYRFERMWPSFPHQWYFDDPRAITIDKNDNVHVVETKHNLIIKLAYEGQLISKWGTSGTGDGQLNEPNGIATDSAGNVYGQSVYGGWNESDNDNIFYWNLAN